MNEPCDCDWCGRCREQQQHQWDIESRRGYGIPDYNEQENDNE